MTRRPHLTEFLAKQGRAARPRQTETTVFDKRANDLVKGVIPAAAIVEDPYPDVNTGIHGRIKVIRNIRGDVLSQLFSRRQIEQHQYDAGLEWQRHYENSMIGALKAANPMKEPVDGGGVIFDALTDKQRVAVRKLAIADRDIGLMNRALFVDLLGKGMSIEQAAAVRGITTVRGKLSIGKQFRDALDILAVTYGLAMKAPA